MSAEAMAHVFRCSPYSGTSKEHATLLAIADTVSDVNDNRFWMGQTELSRKARITPRRLSDALQQLLQDGWLTLVRESTARDPAVYELVLGDREPVWEPRRTRDARAAREDAASGGDVASGQGGRSVSPGVTQRQPNPREPKPNPKTSGTSSPPAASGGAIEGPSYDDFYRAYPRHRTNGRPLGGGSPKKSRAKWDRLTQAERVAVMEALPNYRQDLLLTGNPVQHATTWLNGAEWETYANPPTVELTDTARALAEACGHDPDLMTGDGLQDLIVAAGAIKAAGGTPDGIRYVVQVWKKSWPGIPPAPKPVAKHWHRFAGDVSGQATGRLCPRCRQAVDGHDAELCQILEHA